MLDRSLPAINGGGERRPKAEGCAILGIAHAAVTDFQHVRIIPVAWPRLRVQVSVQVEDLHHTERAFSLYPGVIDIAVGAPQVADIPAVRVLIELIHAEEDGSRPTLTGRSPPGRLILRALQSLHCYFKPGQIRPENPGQLARFHEGHVAAALLDLHECRVIPAEIFGHPASHSTQCELERPPLRYQHRD